MDHHGVTWVSSEKEMEALQQQVTGRRGCMQIAVQDLAKPVLSQLPGAGHWG